MKWLYQISNSINDKKYIGVSISPERRWRQHRTGNTNCLAIKSAISKYGADNFQFTLLCCGEDAYIDDLEIAAISMYNTLSPHGYNLTVGGDGASYSVWESCWNKLLGTDSDTAISIQLGTSADIVANRRKALNIPRYTKLARVNEALLSEVGNHSDKSLSIKYGVSETTIQNFRKKEGVLPLHGTPNSSEFKEEFRSLAGSMSDNELAILAGVNPSTVKLYRTKHKIKTYSMKTGEGWRYLEPSEKQWKFIMDEDLSLEDVESLTGISSGKIQTLRKDKGIKYKPSKRKPSVVWGELEVSALISWKGTARGFKDKYDISTQAYNNKKSQLRRKGLL